ncbi:transmembrane protein 207 [Ursus americanus]|uniref:transmembrane protein 207 n=1 Tax=Ursus americanus TaxID=9643 RepID=UPI001E67DA22|nr:transmembrane protein 207 [Ursus americanus]
MLRSRPFSFTSVISKAGISCFPLFQLVLSDPPCEENEMCINYKDQYTNGWFIWFLLLIFLVAFLCGVVFFCLQCWLRRRRIGSPRRTMAVFAVGDLDTIYGAEVVVNPSVGIHLQTQNPELYPAPSFGTLGPPPPYEEILKSSRF